MRRPDAGETSYRSRHRVEVTPPSSSAAASTCSAAATPCRRSRTTPSTTPPRTAGRTRRRCPVRRGAQPRSSFTEGSTSSEDGAGSRTTGPRSCTTHAPTAGREARPSRRAGPREPSSGATRSTSSEASPKRRGPFSRTCTACHPEPRDGRGRVECRRPGATRAASYSEEGSTSSVAASRAGLAHSDTGSRVVESFVPGA